MIATPYLFQTLGEEDYGLVTLAQTVIMLLGILVSYGFNLNTPKQLALIKDNLMLKQELVNQVIIIRLILAFLCIGLLFILIYFLGLFPAYHTILFLSCVLLVNEAIFPMFISQGFDKLSWISKSNAVAKILYLGLIVLIIRDSSDAKWANFLMGSSALSINLFLLIYIYKKESIRFQWVAVSKVKHWLVNNFQFFSSTIASYVLVNGGYLLLSNFVDKSELGFYALAQRVSILLRMLPVFLTQSILQKATRLYEQDNVKFEEYLKRAYYNGVFITFSIGLVLALTATWVVRILAGEYIPLSANLMRILGFLPFFGMLNISNMIRILVTEQKHILAKAIWITTIVMLVLGSIGCYFFGSYGLAWVLVVAEIFNFWINRHLLLKEGYLFPNKTR